MEIGSMDMMTLIEDVQDAKLQIQKGSSSIAKSHIDDEDKITYAQIPVNLRLAMDKIVAKPSIYTPLHSPHKYFVENPSVGVDYKDREDEKKIINKYSRNLLYLLDALEHEMVHGQSSIFTYGIIPEEYKQWNIVLDKFELLVIEYIDAVGSLRNQERKSNVKGKNK